MKKSNTVLLIIIVVLIIGFAIWHGQKNTDTTPVSTNTEQTSSIKGCYVAGNGKDRYTLNIQEQDGKNASGTLAFKNFEKDSSHGTFKGTYENGILLGDYSFNSEGMDSVMQVAFKKDGDNFIRGYGDVDKEGTHFTDVTKISYDSSVLSLFAKGTCTTAE